MFVCFEDAKSLIYKGSSQCDMVFGYVSAFLGGGERQGGSEHCKTPSGRNINFLKPNIIKMGFKSILIYRESYQSLVGNTWRCLSENISR